MFVKRVACFPRNQWITFFFLFFVKYSKVSKLTIVSQYACALKEDESILQIEKTVVKNKVRELGILEVRRRGESTQIIKSFKTRGDGFFKYYDDLPTGAI